MEALQKDLRLFSSGPRSWALWDVQRFFLEPQYQERLYVAAHLSDYEPYERPQALSRYAS